MEPFTYKLFPKFFALLDDMSMLFSQIESDMVMHQGLVRTFLKLDGSLVFDNTLPPPPPPPLNFSGIAWKILGRNEILTSRVITVTNLWIMTGNNLNLDLVINNAYTKYDQVLSIWSKDIELKQNLTNQGPYLCYKLEL